LVQGTVATIELGKDGYTALLKAKNVQQYDAVISRINLADTDEYQESNIGDTVTVYGDSIHLGEVVNIKAKKIRK